MSTNKKYVFTWNFVRYKNKNIPLRKCVPEPEIQSGFNKFVGILKRVVSISIDYTFTFDFTYITKSRFQ